MALIALKNPDRVEVVESFIQMTLVAAEDISAGAEVRIDAAGKFTNGNGTTATEASLYGIATRTVKAGSSVTAIRKGVLDGYVFSQAFDAPIYASDTDGRLGDAAGTVSRIVGRVIPGNSQLLGAAPDKLLFVDL